MSELQDNVLDDQNSDYTDLESLLAVANSSEFSVSDGFTKEKQEFEKLNSFFEIVASNEIKNFEILRFKHYLSRRYQKEPMAYILGYKHFWKHKFLINKSVLIPRPDTEIVIEETLRYLPIDKSKKVLDVLFPIPDSAPVIKTTLFLDVKN